MVQLPPPSTDNADAEQALLGGGSGAPRPLLRRVGSVPDADARADDMTQVMQTALAAITAELSPRAQARGGTLLGGGGGGGANAAGSDQVATAAAAVAI